MSSAATVQALPHQTTSVGTHSPVAATSNRQYNTSSSQSRDPYYNQQQYNSPQSNASPTSTRRPSRRPSGGNGNGASSNNQQTQQQYYQPSSTAGAPVNSVRTSTTAHTSSPTGAPTSSYSSQHPTMAPGDAQRGVPPVVSPRISSNRPPAQTGTSRPAERDRVEPPSRRPVPTNDGTAHASPRVTEDLRQDKDDRSRSNGIPNGSADDYAAAARARRRGQQSPEGLPHRPSPVGAREQQRSTSQRQQPTPPTQLSREASEVLNRMVVSQPEEDIQREKERMEEAIPSSPTTAQHVQAPPVVQTEDGAAEQRGTRSRHDHSTTKTSKNSKFGDYYLGNVLGEGEFGKVRMGWKQGSDVQVAVKLIRKESVSNPNRMAKVHREISILKQVTHPNIVRLHEMVETENKIGIILEYASGGELFDYILNHRYLKDNAARRLFAQLVSGVGYMHKKGIVHRDLKLENLLLDRNRNIIITDFGFANTFNPADELGDEVEYNLSSRDYIKRMELDKVLPNGMRRGDLMQTSCGSPCYAAPELVVSDSLYTGRKVDVWSCGVILYAMLAGYLPFDDDPANPEGDNINLLYKYIVSTPLTFPEYVTPHARDLLRRILVPDPRKRADLFEVARHSWLSEYSHVVGFITSGTTTTVDIANTHVGSEEEPAPALGGLGRSASVREPSKSSKPAAAVGEMGRKHGNVDPDAEPTGKPVKDTKRRTLQVEYLPPQSETKRGAAASTAPMSTSKTRARSNSQGPVEVPQGSSRGRTSMDKPLPKDPAAQEYSSTGRRTSSSQHQPGMAPPTRPGREQYRSASDTSYAQPPVSLTRPQTGGSMSSNPSRTGANPLPSRGSYSQPAAPTVAGTNAQGRMSQPQPKGKHYNMQSPTGSEEQSQYGQQYPNLPLSNAQSSGFSETSQSQQPPPQEYKTHKRSSTIGSIFGRTGSIFGGKSKHAQNGDSAQHEKPKKSYPPVSMSSAAIQQQETSQGRPSMDSRRSFSFGLGKKRSGSITGGSQTTLNEKPRRSSFLPSGSILKAIGINKDEQNQYDYDARPDSQRQYDDVPQAARDNNMMSGGAGSNQYASDGTYDRSRESPFQHNRVQELSNQTQQPRYPSQQQTPPHLLPPMNFEQNQSALTSQSSLNDQRIQRAQYPQGFNDSDNYRPAGAQRQTSVGGNGRGVLQKPNRKFNDAYDGDQMNGARRADHAGSSGPARKVMDFFRRRRRADE